MPQRPWTTMRDGGHEVLTSKMFYLRIMIISYAVVVVQVLTKKWKFKLKKEK